MVRSTPRWRTEASRSDTSGSGRPWFMLSGEMLMFRGSAKASLMDLLLGSGVELRTPRLRDRRRPTLRRVARAAAVVAATGLRAPAPPAADSGAGLVARAV